MKIVILLIVLKNELFLINLFNSEWGKYPLNKFKTTFVTAEKSNLNLTKFNFSNYLILVEKVILIDFAFLLNEISHTNTYYFHCRLSFLFKSSS